MLDHGVPRPADAIYSGGRILTMAGSTPAYAEAVAVRDGVIAHTGGLAGALALRGDRTAVIDLRGHAMLPGFVDAHSHITFALTMVRQANISSPPVGAVTDIPSIISSLRDLRERLEIPVGQWVIGWGYDAEQLMERRHPTRLDLDPAFPEHPVMLVHVSGHGAVLNSRALELAGIGRSTPTPPGGVIARLDGGTEPAGLVMETAYAPVQRLLPEPSADERFAALDAAQQLYASNGYTHAQDGHTTLADGTFLREAQRRGLLYVDVAALPSFMSAREFLADPAYQFGAYDGQLKFQGIKFIQDGSAQGRTAYMTAPYLTGGHDGDANWCGEPIQPRDHFSRQVGRVLDAGVQVFIHANGDAAIDDAVAAVRESGVTSPDDRRTVVIHSQFQRPDHLEQYAELGMSPSYFTNHCYFWGDVHTANMGAERAAFISPMRAASERGIQFSNHTDFNVTPLDPFFVLWTATARQSRTGRPIGEAQAVDTYTALRAITTGAAWQVFEEHRKGAIRAGMLADFVVLDRDPLAVAIDSLREIRVLETIKQGRPIFTAADSP